MSENESALAETTSDSENTEQAITAEAPSTEEVIVEPVTAEPAVPPEEITYHAVEKDGQVTAIWEMQGRKHLRTIDPRSRQGQDILRLYTSDHHDETPVTESSDAAAV